MKESRWNPFKHAASKHSTPEARSLRDAPDTRDAEPRSLAKEMLTGGLFTPGLFNPTRAAEELRQELRSAKEIAERAKEPQRMRDAHDSLMNEMLGPDVYAKYRQDAEVDRWRTIFEEAAETYEKATEYVNKSPANAERLKATDFPEGSHERRLFSAVEQAKRDFEPDEHPDERP